MSTACEPEKTILNERIRTEIETVHAFISAWFRGDVSQSRTTFDEQLSDRLLALTAAGDRLVDQIGAKLERARSEIRAGMGGLSSRLGGSSSVMAAPVTFDNAEIETVSHVRSARWVRLLRRTRQFVAG